MSRRRTSPLKPQLNQIRTWTQQGRTDAWMAHKLETSSDVVAEFRAEYGIARGGGGPAAVLEPITPELVAEQALEGFEPSASVDDEAPTPRRRSRRRAASDEPAAEEAAAPAPRRRRRAAEPAPEAKAAPELPAAPQQPAAEAVEDEGAERPSRRRSRRRRAAGDEAEAVVAAPAATAPASAPSAPRGVPATLRRTIEIALDASVLDDPVFREHWLGVDGVVVEVRRDELVLRRA